LSAVDDLPKLILVLAVGFAAGFINSLAGGGSLLTLPLLIFLGIPATVANGTNRVALVLQNISAVWKYAKGGVRHLRAGILISIPAILAASVGASVAVNLSDEVLNRIIGVVLIVVGAFVLLSPKRWVEGSENAPGRKPWLLGVAFILVGFYGGFIQAGIGFFILVTLVLWGGHDLVHANAIKVLVILAYTIPALIIFARAGHVDWVTGLILGVGNSTGAWVGAHLGLSKGAGWIRTVLLIAILIAAARLLFAP
jgi:uncharacterized membrane protein YfcA